MRCSAKVVLSSTNLLLSFPLPGVVTRGVFRISGSLRVVNALYDYYCYENKDEDVTHTIRHPNLPTHIKAGVHEVASVFKRLLGALPGGILGSLTLFDALVAIYSQLHAEPEFNRTRQTKLRARLIALAIGTLQSQFQRELICAVFGLLSLIGRQAEIAPHEDEQGRPLPTSDLMGYNALGIIFGPLLVGDLLDSYTMKLAHPPTGLLVFPLMPTKLKEERAESAVATEGPPPVDKIRVVNDITEMLITHWREVVRHLGSLSALAGKGRPKEDEKDEQVQLQHSTSEPFIKNRLRWDIDAVPRESQDRATSPITGELSPLLRARHLKVVTQLTGLQGLQYRRLPACQRIWVPRWQSSGRVLKCPKQLHHSVSQLDSPLTCCRQRQRKAWEAITLHVKRQTRETLPP